MAAVVVPGTAKAAQTVVQLATVAAGAALLVEKIQEPGITEAFRDFETKKAAQVDKPQLKAPETRAPASTPAEIPHLDAIDTTAAFRTPATPDLGRTDSGIRAGFTENGNFSIRVPLPLAPVLFLGHALGSWLFSSGSSESFRPSGPAPRDLSEDPSWLNPIVPPYPYEPLIPNSQSRPNEAVSADNAFRSADGNVEDSDAEAASPAGATEPPGNDPDEDNSGDENRTESSALRNKKIHISKNDMKDLLDSRGKAMYKKLTETLKGKTEGKVWHDRDFRIDAGQPMKDSPSVRTWNLQVNREAESKLARKYKSLPRGTDERLFWGKFDVQNPPTYDEWKNAILASWK